MKATLMATFMATFMAAFLVAQEVTTLRYTSVVWDDLKHDGVYTYTVVLGVPTEYNPWVKKYTTPSAEIVYFQASAQSRSMILVQHKAKLRARVNATRGIGIVAPGSWEKEVPAARTGTSTKVIIGAAVAVAIMVLVLAH